MDPFSPPFRGHVAPLHFPLVIVSKYGGNSAVGSLYLPTLSSHSRFLSTSHQAPFVQFPSQPGSPHPCQAAVLLCDSCSCSRSDGAGERLSAVRYYSSFQESKSPCSSTLCPSLHPSALCAGTRRVLQPQLRSSDLSPKCSFTQCATCGCYKLRSRFTVFFELQTAVFLYVVIIIHLFQDTVGLILQSALLLKSVLWEYCRRTDSSSKTQLILL